MHTAPRPASQSFGMHHLIDRINPKVRKPLYGALVKTWNRALGHVYNRVVRDCEQGKMINFVFKTLRCIPKPGRAF